MEAINASETSVSELHDVTRQKIVLVIMTTVRT
jgi:hypothetical protein